MEGPMETVGAYEAKTHLTQLLERVAKGERITITKHGVPVATLQPADSAKKKPVREIIDQLKRFRSGHRLDGRTTRERPHTGNRRSARRRSGGRPDIAAEVRERAVRQRR